MYSNISIVKILLRYKNHEVLTAAELEELREWLMASSLHEDFFDDLSNKQKWDQMIAPWLAKDSNATMNIIKKRVDEMTPQTRKWSIGWRQYGSAAALVILFAGGIYFWNHKKQAEFRSQVRKTIGFEHEILPAYATPLLTLSDGRVIQLDSVKAGTLARQGLVSVVKTDSAQLDYQTSIQGVTMAGFNKLDIPKGCQYRLKLPDGSMVWLNAASSLRYPISFAGTERRVELSGEAYFEITKNKEKPFLVWAGRSVVRVLGTHFNVNAYPDEPVLETTLVEGSVAIKNGKDSTVIRPGEKARIDNEGRIQIMMVNAEGAIAWKDKLFWFQSASFEQIMRELSRWYDIRVIYQGRPSQTYTGILPTNLPLSNLLGILEKGGNVHFSIEGNKVTVMP